MSITSENGRRVFALEIGGLLYRYHSKLPAGSTNLDANIATGISYVDIASIASVGAFSASIDPSGGIGDYSPVTVSLMIDKKAGAGDAGIIFGRCGARSSGLRAQITETVERDSTLIRVASDLSTLSYPRLLHIGGETVRANSATATIVTVPSGRGVGNTPVQHHSIALEGSIVPEVTEHITTFRGRRAKLYGAHMFADGSTSDYVEIINGFIESSPSIENGDTISLSIVPLSALIDTSLSDKLNQTFLLQDYHYYDDQFGVAIEYATQLNRDERAGGSGVAVAIQDGTFISAATYQIRVPELASDIATLEGDWRDFDESLPAGTETDTYSTHHPRYPLIFVPNNAAAVYSYPTSITYLSTGTNGTFYQVHADTSPSDSANASQIQNNNLFIRLPTTEIKRHILGESEVKQWPDVINDTLDAEGPTAVTGFDGAVAKWRLDTANQRILVSKNSDSIYPVGVWFWSSAYAFRSHMNQRYYGEYPQYFDAFGNSTELDTLARCSYPIDIGNENDGFADDFRTGPHLIKEMRTTSNNLTGSYELRDIAKAYYQLYEKVILVESTLGLPASATVGVYYSITVKYYDRNEGTTKNQVFEVTHQTVATFGGSDVGYLLHLRTDQSLTYNYSFGDWSDSERAIITRGGRFTGQNAGVALLQLLESGGGDGINGTYDVMSVGLNISSDNIDEQSFLAIGSITPFLLSEQFAGDGSDLRSIFESVLRLVGAVLIMKRDETTGKSKIALVPVGAERAGSAALTIQAQDFLTDPVPTWDIYEDIVTQIEFSYDYNATSDEFESNVLFNDQEAINRYGGERSKIVLELPGVDSDQFGRGAGNVYSQFLPTANRLFNLLANPLMIWRGSISTGSSIYLDLGSYIKASSPHFKGYADSYGVTDSIAMIKSINQNLMTEGCELELLHVGLNAVGWNISATVTVVVDADTIRVSSSDFSASDVSHFSVGDVVDFLPTGDQDNAITGLEIATISGNDITFTSAHGITLTADLGTIEPTAYANASTNNQNDAYLANSSDIINTTVDAQEYN